MSLRGVVCADLNGGTAPCEVVLENANILVFSPFCPACQNCIQQIGKGAGIVGLSAQSIPYLRYYQVKLPIRFQVFKVHAEDLRLLGVTQLPCLLTTDEDGGIIHSDYQIDRIVRAVHTKKEVTSERQVGGGESRQAISRIPTRTD